MKHIRIAAAAAFLMIALFIPSMAASAESLGETVSRNTVNDLQAIDYETNETIGSLLAPSRYSMSDKLNKKTEIARREGISPADISDEQAIRELNRDNIKTMSFEDAFARVQTDIEEIIRRIIDSTAGAENYGTAFFTNKILQNKEKLLIGLTYLERLYDFDMGGHNIKDVLLYQPGSYGISADVLDWLIQIGGTGGDTLKISNNANVFGYRKLFWSVTSSSSLDAFLEENRQKWIPDTSINEWFLQESPAYILEKISDWDSKDTGIYKRLYNDASCRAHILPLLTVSEDSVYMIATSGTITYGIVDCYIDRNISETDPERMELREKFLQQLEQAAKQQKSFIDVWHRIAKPEKSGMLSSNRIVLDSLRIDSGATVQWSDKFGKNAAKGVREFFTPLNLYGVYMFADGMAEGERIRYYLSKALTERGFSTYAHELTHILVSEVMLNGYGSRDGIMGEVYTRGMFEPYEPNDPPAFNLNLIYDRLETNDRYHNGVPERFQDETDLQNYMSGILDVVYTLDYAEADVMFSKSTEEKMKWFHKLEQIEDPSERYNQGEEGSKHNLDSVRALTLDEAEKLNTIDDLIRNNIIVSRYEVIGTQTTGTMARNGYYVVPLFSANYSGVQNDHGVSGDIMIRRQAFEFLAEYGYYDGMVPYISNQYKESAKSDQTILSDTYILKKISGNAYETMADFKKAMFQKRIEKIGELKPVTITWKNQSVTINDFEKLLLLMKEAVESDLINVNVQPGGTNNIRAQATEVERLKQEIFKAYLIQTDDFQESIYGAATEQPDNPGGSGSENPDNPGGSGTEQPDNPGGSGTENPDNPGGSGSENPDNPGGSGTEQPDNPGGSGTEQPDNPGGSGSENPDNPGGSGTEQPDNPGGSGSENPDNPGGSGTEQPDNPGGSGSENPDNPGGSGTENPDNPGGSGSENPDNPGGSGTEQPDNPGGSGSEQPDNPGGSGTEQPDNPSGSGSENPDNPSGSGTEKIESTNTETVKNDTVPKLFLCKVSAAGNSNTLRWNSMESADGYEIYGAKSNGTYKRLKTVDKTSVKWKHKKLQKGARYKYYVNAYQTINGKQETIATSLPVFSATKGAKCGNPSKIRTKKTYVSIKPGEQIRLHVKVTGKMIRKAEKKVRYVSSDPSIAEMSKKGIVTGKKCGSCTIYCIAQNGLYKKITVEVKNE